MPKNNQKSRTQSAPKSQRKSVTHPKRSLTYQNKSNGSVSAALNGTSTIMARSLQKGKEEHNIINVVMTMNGSIEYLGESRSTSQLKYFTGKMVVESNDLFGKVMLMYQKKLEKFLNSNIDQVKKDLKVRVSEKMI